MLNKEKGEVMLEGTIVMVVTMMILVWIFGLGFIYYQRYLVTAVTNDAAAKIAATYNNPDSDLVLGYIESENLSDRDLYRSFNNSSLFDVNESKANSYIEYQLKKTNFVGTVDNVEVTMKLVQDSAMRKHVEIRSVCTFNTPFRVLLDSFGFGDMAKYESTACADCTDLIDYISTVDFAAHWTSGSEFSDSTIKFINSLIKLYNHTYAKG